MRISQSDDAVHQGRLFLEDARRDQRRANILVQLAEAAGDEVASLAGYIDMLLGDEHAKYVGRIAELGEIERGIRRS